MLLTAFLGWIVGNIILFTVTGIFLRVKEYLFWKRHDKNLASWNEYINKLEDDRNLK